MSLLQTFGDTHMQNKKNGYLSELSNSILLTVESDDHQKSVEVTDRLTNEINAALDSFGGSVIAQQVVSDNDLQNMAGDYGISEGKAALIRNILNELPMLKAEDLAEMSINDLNLLASSKQIALSNTTTTGSASESGYIGTARAEEIALEHAGKKESEVTFVKAHLDYDDGIAAYEVEFYTADNKEYDYEISAYTGEVLSFDYDIEYYAGQAVRNGGRDAAASGTAITLEQAKEKALAQAGLSASQVRYLNAKQDRDDGRTVYEGSFYYNEMEYEFEIDAATGNVTEWDVESIYD